MRNSVLVIVIFTLFLNAAPVLAQDLIYASPQPTYSPAPEYPEGAKMAGIQGIVAVQVRIETAQNWKFEPAMIAGKATPVVSTGKLRTYAEEEDR